MNVVVSYDISDDKHRNKVAKILQDYGSRVQYSVFELIVNSGQLEQIKTKVKELLEGSSDSIRYYYLCGSCLKRIEVQGVNVEPFRQEEVIIV